MYRTIQIDDGPWDCVWLDERDVYLFGYKVEFTAEMQLRWLVAEREREGRVVSVFGVVFLEWKMRLQNDGERERERFLERQ